MGVMFQHGITQDRATVRNLIMCSMPPGKIRVVVLEKMLTKPSSHLHARNCNNNKTSIITDREGRIVKIILIILS